MNDAFMDKYCNTMDECGVETGGCHPAISPYVVTKSAITFKSERNAANGEFVIISI